MNIKQTIATLNEVEAKGAFGFVAVTSQEALKKSRKTGLPTPAHLATVTCYRACTVSLGNDYQTAVNNRLLAEGKDADFKAKSSYCGPVADNKLVYKHHEADKWYLRVYPNLCKSLKTVVRYFDANGTEITEQWEALREEFFKLPSTNERQGLENPIKVNNYSLENVKYLKRGEILIDELTLEVVSIVSLRDQKAA